MGLALSAGMSLHEFYESEMWEVSVVIDGYLKETTRQYRNGYELARFQLMGTIGSEEASKIVFDWEKDPNEMTPELWEKTRANFKKWEENHKKKLNGGE